jgi:phage shock protein PspC (stress-responsive transcriptional regulator)
MKQVININFHGQVVPIEVSAFDLLKNYTGALSSHFENEEGKEEIINDIESRIGELFQQRLKKGATCITDDDVNAIIKSMGMPQDFELDTEKASTAEKNNSQANEQTQDNTKTNTSTGPKRLFRNENEKVVGGVCSGVASYFGLDPVIVRVVFVLVALFFGTGILAYIILWVAVPSTASNIIGGTRKKLFRDPDDKIIAGIGSGLGNYFGINPWIPRALFLLPFISLAFGFRNWGFMDFPEFINFSFSPGSIIVYIIIWLVIPEASNTAEKLEMKGEKVDMNSIKNSVMGEMKGVQKRAEKFGAEAASIAQEKGQQMGAEIKVAAKRGGTSLGDIIIKLIKVFAYAIIGIVCFSLVVALFGFAIASIGIFPYKDYVVTDGWQNAFAWGTLLFFIAVPVIGVITWIIRRLAKMKSNRKVLRATFISLWVVGWTSFICLVASISKDFRSSNNWVEEEVQLQNPGINKLLVTNKSTSTKYLVNQWLRFEPFASIDEDSVSVNNIEIKILKSPTDSFKVTYIRMVRGSTRRMADTLANKIDFTVFQQDSNLYASKGITINKKDKFRNQKVLMLVYVPVGKQIKIAKGIGYGFNVHIGDSWDDNRYNNIDFEDESNWDHNVDYIMKADGLYTLSGIKASDYDRNDHRRIKIGPNGIEIRDGNDRIKVDENGVDVDDNYRYNGNQPADKIDSLKMKLDAEKTRVKDSLEKEKEKLDKQLEKFSSTKTNATNNPSNKMLLINPVTVYL